MMYQADEKRYETMQYNRCGKSGLLLPKVSLGLWHNFGSNGDYDNMKAMCFTAFDHGITHFDLANNYGPEPGSAEINFGRILKEDLGAYRDEMLISTKAGFDMWDGPYGNWGSKKYLTASLDQSLKRMGLEYVDIFYHHRMDPETPLEETMETLAQIVRSGKALYVGIFQTLSQQRGLAPALFRQGVDGIVRLRVADDIDVHKMPPAVLQIRRTRCAALILADFLRNWKREAARFAEVVNAKWSREALLHAFAVSARLRPAPFCGRRCPWSSYRGCGCRSAQS